MATKIELKAQIDTLLSGITEIDSQISDYETLLDSGEDYINGDMIRSLISSLQRERKLKVDELTVPLAQYSIME